MTRFSRYGQHSRQLSGGVETLPALEVLGHTIATYQVAECRWFLDRPVSNSGRLKRIIEDLAATRGGPGTWSWWPTRTRCWPIPRPRRTLGREFNCRPNESNRRALSWPRPQPPFSTAAPRGSTCAGGGTEHVPAAWVVKLDGA